MGRLHALLFFSYIVLIQSFAFFSPSSLNSISTSFPRTETHFSGPFSYNVGPGVPTKHERKNRGSFAVVMSLPIGEDVALSSRRCAGARFLYTKVVNDPLSKYLAGDNIIEEEKVNDKNNDVYPVVAVRTRWMDEQIKALMKEEKDAKIPKTDQYTQVVICGAGMDARAYRLNELSNCKVFELDVQPVLDYKTKVISTVTDKFPLLAKSVSRVNSDFSNDKKWIDSLKKEGFEENKKTIWILEGFVYYFPEKRCKQMLSTLVNKSAPGSKVLFDHINDFTLNSLQKQAKDKWLTTTFSSSMENPETGLKEVGLKNIKVVTVGEPGVEYGIWRLPHVPREEDSKVMRTYLISANI